MNLVSIDYPKLYAVKKVYDIRVMSDGKSIVLVTNGELDSGVWLKRKGKIVFDSGIILKKISDSISVEYFRYTHHGASAGNSQPTGASTAPLNRLRVPPQITSGDAGSNEVSDAPTISEISLSFRSSKPSSSKPREREEPVTENSSRTRPRNSLSNAIDFDVDDSEAGSTALIIPSRLPKQRIARLSDITQFSDISETTTATVIAEVSMSLSPPGTSSRNENSSSPDRPAETSATESRHQSRTSIVLDEDINALMVHE